MVDYDCKRKPNLKNLKGEKFIRPINKRIGEYKTLNAQPVLLAVEKWIRILEARHRY